MADESSTDRSESSAATSAARALHSAKGKGKKKGGRKKGSAQRRNPKDGGRKRTQRPYPAVSFEDALPLAGAIQGFASGERVRRLTLLTQLQKNPNSSATRMLITNSSRYGLTTGSYAAEWLALTDLGKVVTSPDTPPRAKREAEFKLAIADIEPFNFLYEQYKTKRLPSHEVLKDALRESGKDIADPQECIDTFIVNAKYLGLLSTIAGAETLLPIDHVLDDLGTQQRTETTQVKRSPSIPAPSTLVAPGRGSWAKICFYIAPIGEEGTEIRKHSDLFLGSLLEPALKDLGLEVVRADKIAEPGMITSQVIEHIMRAGLVVVDMSYHNPSVFYEMALRHACRQPIVQITRKADKLPFDVNQMRTVVIDTTDIYSLVPRLETFKSEIATQVRAALADGGDVMTPISVFFPGFSVTIPEEK